jgi:hypothetical protein
MQVSHTARAVAAAFDDTNLVSVAGLVPLMKLAEKAGLRKLADKWLSIPTDKGAHAGLKVASLVGGMVAGADSIADMAVLRHGGMRKLFGSLYAPSTLGSFLRSFRFGHVRQLDAVASRFLINLATLTPLVHHNPADAYVFLDVDDTIIEVHGYQKQGSGYGYSKVRGLNVFIQDALATLRRLPDMDAVRILFRADSAFYIYDAIHAALKRGADVSVTARQDSAVKKAIATIPETAWTPIKYTDAIFDESSKTWISDAEVAEVPYTAFLSRKEGITGRLVVRRIPELNKKADAGQLAHRAHAVIELVNSDLKSSALAHMPSGIFTANAAWLVLAIIAFNLTRAAATVAGTGLARATTATIRRKLIQIPARIASSARRVTLHLPEKWPWEAGWTHLFDHMSI